MSFIDRYRAEYGTESLPESGLEYAIVEHIGKYHLEQNCGHAYSHDVINSPIDRLEWERIKDIYSKLVGIGMLNIEYTMPLLAIHIRDNQIAGSSSATGLSAPIVKRCSQYSLCSTAS